MTGFAGVSCCQMRWRLTAGDNIVMTIDTVAQYLRMIYGCCRRPGSSAVTCATIIRGCDVIKATTSCLRAVMTGHATAKNLIVINRHCRHPGRGIVTGIADIRRLNMRR